MSCATGYGRAELPFAVRMALSTEARCLGDGAAGSGNGPYVDHASRGSGLIPGQQGAARVEGGPW